MRRPEPPRRGRSIEGQVKGLQARTEGGGNDTSPETIWTFRLERYDDAGNRVGVVPVEMRGLRFEGSLADGDVIRAQGRFRSGTFRASEIENVTTGAEVRSRGVPKIAMVVFSIFFALVVGFIGWIAYTGFTSDPMDPPDGLEFPSVVVDGGDQG